MCTVLLAPGVNPVAVNKYIKSHHIIYHIISYHNKDKNNWPIVVQFPTGARSVFFQACRITLEPSKPPNQRVRGAKLLEVERQGHAADFSPSNSAKVKNKWMYTSVLPRLHVVRTDTYTIYVYFTHWHLLIVLFCVFNCVILCTVCV